MIVCDYYIFISLLCFNFLYVIFELCLREKQSTKQKKTKPLKNCHQTPLPVSKPPFKEFFSK